MKALIIYCREFVEFLNDYLSGLVSAEKKAEFDAHLAVCPPCVSYLKTYDASVRMGKKAFDCLDEPVPADIPEDLVRAVLAAREKGR